jgi:hypothetical protein
MAKMMAYVDCTYIMISNSDPNLCDCNRIVDTDAIPLAPDQPDKQKEISLKADWKYIGAIAYRFPATTVTPGKTQSINSFQYHPQEFLHAVFHPPRS